MAPRFVVFVKNSLVVIVSIVLTLAAIETSFYFLNRSPWRDRFRQSQNASRQFLNADVSDSSRKFEIASSLLSLPNINPNPEPFVSRFDLLDRSGKNQAAYYDLGYRERLGVIAPLPARVSRSRLALNSGELIYDVNYSIDEFRRRVVPQKNKQTRLHTIFMGCSITWGEGVNDDETFAYYYAKNAPDQRIYNISFHGYGPNDLLRRAQQDPEFWAGIKEDHGIAIYVFIGEHLSRALGNMSVTGTWGSRKPRFEEDERGAIAYQGSFESSLPLRTKLFSFLAKSETLDFFRLDYPMYYSDHDFKLFARIVGELEKEYLKRFPKGRFLVLFLSPKGKVQIADELANLGIHFIDYSGVWWGPLIKGPALLPYDGHWTAGTHRLVGDNLFRDLKNFVTKDEISREQ